MQDIIVQHTYQQRDGFFSKLSLQDVLELRHPRLLLLIESAVVFAIRTSLQNEAVNDGNSDDEFQNARSPRVVSTLSVAECSTQCCFSK